MTPESVVSWMTAALSQAEKSWNEGGIPIGSVLVDSSGTIVAAGHNERVQTGDPTAHAEILALREAAGWSQNYRLPGTAVYVTLEPCIMCAGALMLARVDAVVFGARDPRAGAAGSVTQVRPSA